MTFHRHKTPMKVKSASHSMPSMRCVFINVKSPIVVYVAEKREEVTRKINFGLGSKSSAHCESSLTLRPAAPSRILAPRKDRHGLARAQPDSPALRPLHSASFQLRRLHFHFAAFHGHKLPRQAGKRRALPKWEQAPPVVSTAIFRPLHSAGAAFRRP
jgi:hypothetical protein